MPIESPPASVAMTCRGTLLAIRIGRRRFVTSVRVAVAREADAAADVVIADDGLDVVRAEGERRGSPRAARSFTEKR
jgi:hypothetical protein